MKTLLILAGGTGGHIMPGIAIAEAMRSRGWNIRWLGTAHGMENTLVPKAGIALDTIAFSGLRGKGWAHRVGGASRLVAGFVACLRLIGQIRPHAVLGMGGYVTVPGGLSAALRRRPLLLVNSDAAVLLSNKILWPFARRVLFGLPGYVDPESQASHRAPKAEWTGSPVRAEISAIAAPAVRFAGRSGPLKVFVVGGSLGAAVLNRVVPLAIAKLAPEDRPLVTHQSGVHHCAELREAYAEAGVIAETLPFIEDMAERYAEADVVVCRAGAITINELMVAGVASVLIPLMVSTTSHQRDNAETMHRVGAAIHLPQAQLSPEKLAELLRSLTRDRLLTMAQTARKLARPDATERVADIIEAEASAEVSQ